MKCLYGILVNNQSRYCSHANKTRNDRRNGRPQTLFNTAITHDNIDKNKLLQAAELYIRHGLRIIPLPPRQKKAAMKLWLERATLDVQEYAEWLRNGYLYEPNENKSLPTGGIGIVTGRGIFVLDVDVNKGGFETLAALEEKYGAVPVTPHQITGSGGRHYFFRCAGHCRNRTGFQPGLDIRGDGGFVVAAPSIHPRTGREYQWAEGYGLDGLLIADAPSWLQDLLNDRTQENISDNRTATRGTAALIPEGMRNQTLTSIAGTMRQRGLGEEPILAALLAHNRNVCSPPLEEREVRQIAASISRYPAGSTVSALPSRATLEEKAQLAAIDLDEGYIEMMDKHVGHAGQQDELARKSEANENYAPFIEDIPIIIPEYPDLTAKGKIKPTLRNVRTLIDHLEIKLTYDEIKKDTTISHRGQTPYSLDNSKEASLGALISKMVQGGIPVEHLGQYLCEIADRNRINPVMEWITSKSWDRIRRVKDLCQTVTPEPYYGACFKNILIHKWLLSAVAAACHDPRIAPSSSRGVLVFIGKQGIGKTRWFRGLVPQQWVRDGVMLDPSNKDSVMGAICYWIVELGEMDSTFRRDIGRLKAFLTKEQDQLRLPYAKRESQFPRRTVFCASVNEPEFLVDRTGNDRFWTIPVLTVDYDHGIDMQQVFAEIYEEWKNGTIWWLKPEEGRQLTESNKIFEERDEVYDLLMSNINWADFSEAFETGLVEWLNPTGVLIKRCGFISKPTKGQANSCAAHLRKLTGQDSRQMRGKGRAFPVPLGTSEE